jgi:hypothetical protein
MFKWVRRPQLPAEEAARVGPECCDRKARIDGRCDTGVTYLEVEGSDGVPVASRRVCSPQKVRELVSMIFNRRGQTHGFLPGLDQKYFAGAATDKHRRLCSKMISQWASEDRV